MPEVSYTNVTNTTAIPPWMQTAIQDILGRGTGLANEAYQPYGGQRVAGFNADQNAGFDFLRDNNTAYAPWLGAAGNFTLQGGGADSGMAGRQSFGQAANMFGAGANVDSAGIASPLIQQGTGYLQQSTAEKSIDAANPYIQQSVAPTGLGMASPYIQQSTSPTGLAAASPYLGMAGTSFPGMADEYMNPYMRNVTDEIARLGGRNLSENLLPQISDQFVRAGQFGSAQQRDVVGRALRDTQEGILGAQSQALQQGYGQAQQAYGQDAGRYASLAGTAGGLGNAQQQALLQAGQSLGGLGQGQQQILQGAGATLGGLSSADMNRLQQAGLGIGNFGVQQAQLAGQDASRQIAGAQGIAGIGQAQIQAAQADYARQVQAGGQMGQLANLQNNFVLQNAGALGAIGDQQQGLTQRNLDTAYGDFQQQQQYPWQQLGALSNIVHGLPMNTTTSGQTTTTQPSPSLVSQVGGLAVGGLGLANSGIFRAKGGAVRKRKSAHSYGNVPRRGISFAEAA